MRNSWHANARNEERRPTRAHVSSRSAEQTVKRLSYRDAMNYYIASTNRDVIEPTGVRGWLYQQVPQTSPCGTLHAVEVGVTRVTVCERGIIQEQLKPFPGHDWAANIVATPSHRCPECVATIADTG